MGGREDGEFIRQFTPLVERIVESTRRRYGLIGERDDLMQMGFVGLDEARARYAVLKERWWQNRARPSPPPVRVLAYYRIRWRVLDGVRKMGSLTRRQQQRLRLDEGIDALTEPHTARPTRPRSREEALRAIDTVLGAVAAAYVVGASTDDAGGDEGGSPEAALLRRERAMLVRKALAKLDEREQRIIEGSYFHGRRLDDVIAEVGLSRSRGRYIHNVALGKLRDALKSA